MNIVRIAWYVLLAGSLSGCASGVTVETDDDGGQGGNGTCATGSILCGGKCVNPASDAANCGSCGNSCGFALCDNGTCTEGCSGALVECAPGECVDVSSDPEHCGMCNQPCVISQTCVAGSCICPATAPDACPDGCTDVSSDPNNCGGCGNPCPGSCVNGSCQSGCMAGETQCGNECVDTSSDDANCGSCLNVCPTGTTCMFSICTCATQTCGACAPTSLASMAPQSVSGSTLGGMNNLDPTCAGSGAPDVAYSFTPSSAGSYTFDTFGTSFDTALYAFDAASCTSLGCNDDTGGLQSSLSFAIAAGQEVIVVVDGYDSTESGSYVLNVTGGGACPTGNLGSTSPQTVNGNNANSSSTVTSAFCNGSGPENSYSFTAPANGTYTIDTIGSSFDTVLHVRNGTCAGAELACDDDGGGGLTSLLTVALTQGQVVVIFADSYSSGGAYVMHISGP